MVGKPGQVAGPLEIQIVAISGKGWRKNRDLDNLAKPLIDLLKHTGIIEDDNSTIVKKITLLMELPIGAEDASVVITVQTLGV
jgi:Holliday junction resolvase RusA-like endonuclease